MVVEAIGGCAYEGYYFRAGVVYGGSEMISNDKLKNVANIIITGEDENLIVRASFIKEMAKELLSYRDRENESWDFAPSDALYRRKGWIYYDKLEYEDLVCCGIPNDYLEERPKS